MEFTYFSSPPSLSPLFSPSFPSVLLFMFLLKLSDSRVQRKEAVLIDYVKILVR